MDGEKSGLSSKDDSESTARMYMYSTLELDRRV